MVTYNSYTEEQGLFLKNNSYGTTRKKLCEEFNKTFGTNKSINTIKSWCSKHNISSGNDGRFKKGNRSWQTGLSAEEYKSHFTEESFKRGIAPLMNKRIHKVGDTMERRKNDFYVIIDITPNLSLEKRTQRKGRYVYEKAYGKIPPSHRIIHLDGNKANNKLKNLYCIPTKFIPLINKNHWLTNNRENTLTAIKICELQLLLKNQNNTEEVYK